MSTPDKSKVNALRRRVTKESANIADSFTPPPTSNEAAPTKRLNVEIPADFHTFLKTKAARESTEVRKLVIDALRTAYGAEREGQ